jgi:hypothetical protein
MTAGQATVFLQAAAAWSAWARRAAADPGYDIAAETRLAGAVLVAAGLLTRRPAPPPRAVMRPVLPHRSELGSARPEGVGASGNGSRPRGVWVPSSRAAGQVM